MDDLKKHHLAFLILVLLGLLTACAGPQQTQHPAGTSTQDPPIPQLTEATDGILDTTGTVPDSLLTQLRARSNDAQAHGYQIAVVFFNDLAGDAHQFATEVFNANGIGFKDRDNGVLFVLYLQKPGKDGHTPWLTYITGGGISTALPDTLMDDSQVAMSKRKERKAHHMFDKENPRVYERALPQCGGEPLCWLLRCRRASRSGLTEFPICAGLSDSVMHFSSITRIESDHDLIQEKHM